MSQAMKRLFNPMKKFAEVFDKDCDNSQFAMDYCPEIQVEPETRNPTKVWQRYKVKRKVKDVKPKDLEAPIFDNKVRIVCISDTHCKIEKKPEIVPDGDILVHAGDFTNIGLPSTVEEFNDFLGKLPHPHKIVIAGNHEQTFMEEGRGSYQIGYCGDKLRSSLKSFHETSGLTDVKQLLTNCTYLEDSGIEIYGIKFYGSPWTPEFYSWAFMAERGEEILEYWNKIPEDTDVLITHGPPLGYGDGSIEGLKTGCVELLNTIQKRVRPKYHVYGHIHEGYGIRSDGYTTFINASTCSRKYQLDNKPVIFDIPLPPGCSETDAVKGACTSGCDEETGSGALAKKN